MQVQRYFRPRNADIAQSSPTLNHFTTMSVTRSCPFELFTPISCSCPLSRKQAWKNYAHIFAECFWEWYDYLPASKLSTQEEFVTINNDSQKRTVPRTFRVLAYLITIPHYFTGTERIWITPLTTSPAPWGLCWQSSAPRWGTPSRSSPSRPCGRGHLKKLRFGMRTELMCFCMHSWDSCNESICTSSC